MIRRKPMKKYEEICVLKETKKNAEMAIKAIDTLMQKVYNQEFAYELTSQKKRFQEFERKAEAGLWEYGITAKKSPWEEAMLWSGIQMNTLWNISTPHVADMMIQGNTRGIADLMKVRHNNKNAGSFANEMAEELMDFEEENIERLKGFCR